MSDTKKADAKTADPHQDSTETTARKPVPLVLDPCEKAHDAEHDRLQDEDGACDEGVN